MDVPSFRNEISGSAQMAVQVGHQVGNTIIALPPVPEPRPRIPHQVPAADRYFADRVADLARFAGLGSWSGAPPPVLVVVVTGPPGVGKTALIRRVVEILRDRFDIELHIDYAALRSRVGREAAVGEAQLAILRDLGVGDRYLPTAPEARANLIRTCTAERTVLLVLDDVTEPRQVRDLLPKAPGSVVLTTSDHRIGELVSLDGAELYVLDLLDEDGARQLLAAVCREDRIAAEPAAVTELIRLCGRLPLALRVAAARLVLEPTLTVAELVAEVRQDLDALSLPGYRGVSAVFTAAYQILPDMARRAYRIFGSVPGLELTAELVQVALGLSAQDAQAAVRALHTANLVKDQPGRRYRFFDLVRRHAAAAAEQDEDAEAATAALRLVVDHHLVRAGYADRAVMGPDRLRLADHARLTAAHDDPFTVDNPAAVALQWLWDERLNLMAVLALCDDRGWDERTCVLAEASAALFLNRRRPYDLIDACAVGARAAARLGRHDLRARMLAMGSRGHLDLGRLDQARQDLDLARSLAEESDNPLLRASVWEFWGRYLDEVDLAQAVDAYRTSIDLNEQAIRAGYRTEGRRGAALATFFLGRTTQRLGRHDEALGHLRHALDELRALSDERMAARVQASIGAAYRDLGRDIEAAESLMAAVRVLAYRGAAHYEAEALETLATVTERLGNKEAAQRALARAAKIREATGSARAEALRQRLD